MASYGCDHVVVTNAGSLLPIGFDDVGILFGSKPMFNSEVGVARRSSCPKIPTLELLDGRKMREDGLTCYA